MVARSCEETKKLSSTLQKGEFYNMEITSQKQNKTREAKSPTNKKDQTT